MNLLLRYKRMEKMDEFTTEIEDNGRGGRIYNRDRRDG